MQNIDTYKGAYAGMLIGGGIVIAAIAAQITNYRAKKQYDRMRQNIKEEHIQNIKTSIQTEIKNDTTIDKLLKDTNKHMYQINARVVKTYTVPGIRSEESPHNSKVQAYRGLLRDESGTIQFECNTNDFSDKDTTLIPLLLNESTKNNQKLKLTVTTSNKPAFINITSIIGKYDNLEYKLNIE
jgi:hypothetical protein